MFIKQSRETETDRAIENTLKGFGNRISGDAIYFPNDPTFSPKEGGYIFDSSIPYDAGENLGKWNDIFIDPFSIDNKTAQGGLGFLKTYMSVVKNLIAYITNLSPYAVYRRFVINADKKFRIDTSADNAKFKVQQNLDLSVIPEPKIDGNTIEIQRQIALQRANQRIPDVTTVLNSLKISGQFNDVQVGGNTAIYSYTLPPDPNLPNDYNKFQDQFSTLLRIKSKPIITLDAGVLKISLDNGVNIPVSFADMIKRRKKGVSNIISGLIGVDAMGEPVYFELGDKNPHIMIFGKTGTGKTVLIMTILYSVMSATDPKHLRIIYIDGKGNSFEFMSRDSSHPNPFTYAPPGDASGDIDYARSVIKFIEKETRRRIDLFKKEEVSKLAEYNKLMEKLGKEILPEILVVVDEFSAITQQDKDLKASELGKLGTIDTFEYIAKMARSVGIRMLMANQSARKELVPGKISANITARISLGVSEPIESEIALPETGIAVHLLSQPGEFYSTIK
ncbi:cell division protein FtsK, partial [Campylobacter jejuni]|nr:cell division protein FtsK [Campylobacter jejuni]